MSRALESDASLPVLLAFAAAGSICAIGVGVSSLRKRPKNPPLFFLSFSAGVSGAACGAHSSARAAAASFAGAAGAAQGLTFGGGSFGFALGAHSFAIASFEAGGAVIHDSAGAPGAREPWTGAPWTGAPWAGAPVAGRAPPAARAL